MEQLNQAVQDYLVNKEEAAKRIAFHQALVTSGLVRQIKKPSGEQTVKRQLIQVQGEPISRTIVEERR